VQIAEFFAESQEKDMSLEIRASTTMEEIPAPIPARNWGSSAATTLAGALPAATSPRTRSNRSWATTIFQTRWRL